MLEKLMTLINQEITNTLEDYRNKKIEMVGTNPKGKSIHIEKKIPDYLCAGILTAAQMRLQAIELRKKADQLETDANNTLMPNMIVAAVKTITLEGIGQVVYREGSKNKPKYPEDELKAQALAMSFKAEDIKQAWPGKVNPQEKLRELGYDDKKIKELWKAVEIPPKQEKGDPTIAFTPWENMKIRRGDVDEK